MLVELQAVDGHEAAEDKGLEFVGVAEVLCTPAPNLLNTTDLYVKYYEAVLYILYWQFFAVR